MGQIFDARKTSQLILYVCRKMADGPEFGSTVLNKVLFYADHTFYVQQGKTITGLTYVKQESGPTPSPKQFSPLRERMINEGALKIKESSYLGKIQKRPVALATPDLEKFSGKEVATIDEVIEVFKGVNAATASEISHSELGWQVAGMMEEIPPFAYLLSEAELTEDDIKRAKEYIAEDRAAKLR
jgi:hypothetical protein